MNAFEPLDFISSTKNPRIRNFARLKKARERQKQQLFIIEGTKEIERALEGGYSLKDLFFCSAIVTSAIVSDLKNKAGKEIRTFEVSLDVYNHIAYRENREGVIAWAVPGIHELDLIQTGNNPLILVLESVEKPGNLGAVLRTADAAGLEAVILADPQTDIYNPNVVRSSLGTLFTVPLAVSTTEEIINWLKSKKINIYCTALSAAVSYLNTDFKKPSAVVMGTESTGLSDKWLKASGQNIIIPMYGRVDSMNVSVSAGIVVFEALRQRNKGNRTEMG